MVIEIVKHPIWMLRQSIKTQGNVVDTQYVDGRPNGHYAAYIGFDIGPKYVTTLVTKIIFLNYSAITKYM